MNIYIIVERIIIIKTQLMNNKYTIKMNYKKPSKPSSKIYLSY